MKEHNIDLDFDFGFSAMDEDELDRSSDDLKKTSTELERSQEKLTKLYTAVGPLLKNLTENPEKDYIYWPDRQKKVDAFAKKLKKIYES